MKILFESQEVQKLLDDFQKLVGVRIGIFDTHFNELYASPRLLSNFCLILRNDEQLDAKCRQCDHHAFLQAAQKKDTYLYRCHLGLYEAITPLYDAFQILGYVMVGQIVSNVHLDEQWLKLSHELSVPEGDLHLLKESFYQLKQLSIPEIESVSRIMNACAHSIWLKHIIEIERSPITTRIQHYIDTHYTENVTTQQLCTALHISKTSIYNYLKSEFDMSLSKYMNHVRIRKAQTLLHETHDSISEIAQLVGFEDYNYFTRQFKKQCGVSPSQYRKQILLSLMEGIR